MKNQNLEFRIRKTEVIRKILFNVRFELFSAKGKSLDFGQQIIVTAKNFPAAKRKANRILKQTVRSNVLFKITHIGLDGFLYEFEKENLELKNEIEAELQ